MGVETAIRGVVVLPAAGRTHLKGGHGGLCTVIGDICDDGESRPTIGAVDEGIAKATVLRIEELSPAVFADGYIR